MGVGAMLGLNGGMIPRNAKREFDERLEEREEAGSCTAELSYRGRKHAVRLVNLSPSGAMLMFAQVPHIGERVSLLLPDHGPLTACVRWVKGGRVGINFDAPAELTAWR